MLNTDIRPAATQTRLFNRRNALRLAFTAIPVGAAVVWPAMANAATPQATQVNGINAVSRTATAAFTLGTTKPWGSNSGVAAGSTLTVVNGDLNMVAGRTYQNLDIHGFVNGAAGATLLNSRVRGRGTGYISAGLVNGNANTVGMRISGCTLLPDVSRYFLNGFNGFNCLIERCDISNVVDAIHATGDNVLVHGNYIHDFSFFDGSTGTDHASDAVHPGWTHNDAIQHMGGSGMRPAAPRTRPCAPTPGATTATASRSPRPAAGSADSRSARTGSKAATCCCRSRPRSAGTTPATTARSPTTVAASTRSH